MNIQKSFERTTAGKLYVVPTPIGHLADMTYRAVEVLQLVAIIAAEDTRHSQKLLNHYKINTPLISYHEHNERERSEQLLERMEQGNSIALVSDAGMPGISDPGHVLIKQAIALNVSVVVLPGANAALTALIGSGLATDQFLFYGFLPRKQRSKHDTLATLKEAAGTLIFYESPYRVIDTIEAIHEQLGNRKIVIARELTKQYETYIRGSVTDVKAWLKNNNLKGECCIIVSGIDGDDKSLPTKSSLWWSPYSVDEHVEHYMDKEKYSTKDAIKQVAEDRQMNRRDVYQRYHGHS